MKRAYPTFILDMNDGSEHPFLACVPDLDIYTEGESFADAMEMARDAIGATGISMEDHQENIPEPSEQMAAVEKVRQGATDLDLSKGILTYVDVNFSEYRKKIDMKTVRRNVALPKSEAKRS